MNYIFSIVKEALPIIICVVALQYILAMLCIYRLFKYKPKLFGLAVWNFLIIAVIFIGPLFYLIVNFRHREPGIFMNKLLKVETPNAEDDAENITETDSIHQDGTPPSANSPLQTDENDKNEIE